MSDASVTDEVEKAFFAGARSERLPFVLNDVVRIGEGKMKGQIAWVVRVRVTGSEPRYLLELWAGAGDVEASAAECEIHER